MKKKYYWKMVKSVGLGIYGSCVIIRGKYSLFYKIGVPTKSAMGESGIFVFDTRENARCFGKSRYCKENIKIFKCEVHGEEISEPVCYSAYGLLDNVKIGFGIIFPKGTRLFPSITLVK